jgi:hypothetical protein
MMYDDNKTSRPDQRQIIRETSLSPTTGDTLQ